MSPMSEASAETLRALHEKIENAFAAVDENPPQAFQTPFHAGAQRQAALFGDLNARIERLEDSSEIVQLRESLREMCGVISGLAVEAERGANERDEKIATLAHALQGQLHADRERMDTLEVRVVNSESASARSLDDVLALVRQLAERMRLGDAHNEDLAHNMRVLREELANLNQTTILARKLEERIGSQDVRHEDLARNAAGLKDELAGVSQAATAAVRQLEDRFKAADVRHDDLSRDMTRLKGEVLSDAAAVMHEHKSQMEQAERAISELKDRNARSADRIESLADNLGSLGRKMDSGTERLLTLTGNIGDLGRKLEGEVNGAQLLAERLGTVEKWIAKSHERERARAELHARLADTLVSRED